MHDQEYEQQRVSDEILLAVVTKFLIMFTSLFINLNRFSMNWFVTDEGYAVPNEHEEPIAENLNQ